MAEFLTMKESEWPHGLSCIECDRYIAHGAPFSERLVSMVEEVPVVEIVCVYCGVGDE